MTKELLIQGVILNEDINFLKELKLNLKSQETEISVSLKNNLVQFVNELLIDKERNFLNL